jgi:GxxExxY protein
MSGLVHHALSNKVLKVAFNVHHALGPGFLESAYEDTCCRELAHFGIRYERQKVYPLMHRGQRVCGYIADLVAEDTIIMELKAVAQLIPIHEAQLLHYLKLSRLPVGYLFNFNALRLEWKRFVNTKG